LFVLKETNPSGASAAVPTVTSLNQQIMHSAAKKILASVPYCKSASKAYVGEIEIHRQLSLNFQLMIRSENPPNTNFLDSILD
jgi:hypothetical protein